MLPCMFPFFVAVIFHCEHANYNLHLKEYFLIRVLWHNVDYHNHYFDSSLDCKTKNQGYSEAYTIEVIEAIFMQI